MERLCGRVAIVTGASAGIGVAIARLLVENGMKVVGVARRVDRIKSLAADLKGCKGELHSVEGDVTKEEDVVRVVKWTRDNLGGADVLVNNAGVGGPCSLVGCDTEKMRRMLDVNVLGLCIFTREVIKDMRDRGFNDGHIIHIGSTAGQFILNYQDGYFYSGTKHAVRVMTEGLRTELRDLKTKIKVTGISPGLVRTEFAQVEGMSVKQAKNYYDHKPCLEDQDVAQALLYALSTPPHVQVHEITMHPMGEA